MLTDPNTHTRINHEKLGRFVQAAFEKLGVASGDAQIAAETIQRLCVDRTMRGASPASHGTAAAME